MLLSLLKQSNLMIKNMNSVDYLPSTSSITFSKNNQIFTRYFTTDVLFNPHYGANTIVNAIFNSSTATSLNNNQFQQSFNISKLLSS